MLNKTKVQRVLAVGLLLHVPCAKAMEQQKDISLYAAISSGDPISVLEVLATDSNLNVTGQHGSTPLHWILDPAHAMTSENRTLILHTLLAYDAKITNPNDDGLTALHVAALSTLPEWPTLLDLMYEKSVTLDLIDTEGQTPLHAAVAKGRLDAVKYLITRKADLEARDFQDRTPLELAFESHLPTTTKAVIAQELIEAGADMEACDADKRPLLFKVINNVDVLGVEMLLGHGANCKRTDLRNRSILAFAQRKVEKSTHPNVQKVLEVVRDYYEGRRVPRQLIPQSLQPQTTCPQHVSISIPEDLQGSIDVTKFRTNMYKIMTTPVANGKTLLHIALERSFSDPQVVSEKKDEPEVVARPGNEPLSIILQQLEQAKNQLMHAQEMRALELENLRIMEDLIASQKRVEALKAQIAEQDRQKQENNQEK